jgi:hypothetical protein
LKTSFLRFPARAAACLGAVASLALGQSDPLVSKTVSRVIADQAGFWAFSSDGLHYSRIDPSKDPLDIRNGALKLHGGVRGGAGRAASALLFYGYGASDSVTVGGVVALDRDGKFPQDTVAFLRPAGQNKSITLGVEFSALALWRDTVVIGGGRGGIAVAKAKPEGQGALAGDSLIFRALPAGEDTGVSALRCALNTACVVSAVSDINDKIGEPDSVAALAVDSSADSVWLLIGTHAGLRRGRLGGNSFPMVALPSAKPGAIRIERIYADPARAILWVFSGSEYFFSGDHGRSFHKPPHVPGVASAPEALTGFNAAPEAVSAGDTTYINLNLDDPGLVLFRRDSIAANQGTGDFADVIFDKADGLDIERGQGRLTNLAALSGSGGTTLIAGSTFKGLFLRKPGAAWTNVNSLKALTGGLEEVITFPTLFSGTAPDGSPEYVNLGYRLKKDGKVTITVYDYAMEKVKTLVKGGPRKGGGNRSEKAGEDRWDGTDASGRHVSVGTYYILIESDKGEKGWGKAIAVHGRDP